MAIPSWILGCIISLCGSLCANIGVNIQKFSFNREATLITPTNTTRRQYYSQPYWLLGLFLVISGGISDFVALAIAAQTIIAPISSINLVINLLFASLFLHERILVNDIIGTVLLVFGSVLSVMYGNHNDQTHTLDELISYVYNVYFLVFLAVLLVVVLPVSCTLIMKYQPIYAQLEHLYAKQAAVSYNNNSSDTDSVNGDMNGHNTIEHQHVCDSIHIDVSDKPLSPSERTDAIITQLELQYHGKGVVLPIAYCTLSGVCASFAMLFGKCISELINATINGDNQFVYLPTYLYLTGTVFSVIGQLDMFARALQVYDCCVVVPLFKAAFLICSTVAGLCYFKEFEQFDTMQAVMFTVGILINVIGIGVLSSRPTAAVGGSSALSRSNSAMSQANDAGILVDGVTEPLLSDRSVSSAADATRSSSDDMVPTRSQSGVTLNHRATSHPSHNGRHGFHSRNVSSADKLTMLFAPSLERTITPPHPSYVLNGVGGGKHHKAVSTTQQTTPDSAKVVLTNR